MRVELSDGAWAEFPEPETIRERDRRKIVAAAQRATGEKDLTPAEASWAVADETLAHLVQSWSLDLPVPSENADSLQDLSPAQYDALSNAISEFRKRLFPSADVDPDPESPTEPSPA